MTSWASWVADACSYNINENVLNDIRNNPYILQVLSEYNLPSIVNIVISDKSLLEFQWAKKYQSFEQFSYMFKNEQDKLLCWLFNQIKSQPDFFKTNVLEYASYELLISLQSYMKDTIEASKRDDDHRIHYKTLLLETLTKNQKKRVKGDFYSDTGLQQKDTPDCFIPLQYIWKAYYKSNTDEQIDGEDAIQGKKKSQTPQYKKLKPKDVVLFKELIEEFDNQCSTYSVPAEFLALMEELQEGIDSYQDKLKAKTDFAINELLKRGTIYISQAAEYWGYTEDIDDAALDDLLLDILENETNPSEILADFLCITKSDESQNKLLQKIHNYVLKDYHISILEIYWAIQKNPMCSQRLLNTVLCLQEEVLREALVLANQTKRFKNETKKKAKELNEVLCEPVSALERTLSSFTSWKSYDEKRTLRFFKKCMGQVVDIRTALKNLGLDTAIETEDWLNQRAIPFDSEKHQGQILTDMVVPRTLGFRYTDELDEIQIVCADVIDAPDAENTLCNDETATKEGSDVNEN